MSRQPLVSIIIVSFNRAADLQLSLAAIFASNYDNFEVIVIDNASSDDAADRAASFAGVDLVRSPENLGFAQGNNLGLQRAHGELIALVNNDAVLEPDWISKSVAILEAHPEAAAVGGKHYYWSAEYPVGRRENPYYAYSELQKDGDTPAVTGGSDELREVVTLTGSAVMVRRQAIEAVGEPFLDPTFFMYYEETDFFARALKRGYRLYYSGEPACWHRVTMSHAERPYNYHYYIQRNRLLFASRHFDDQALQVVREAARKRAVSARRRRVLSAIRKEPDRDSASRDAWQWYEENSDFLSQQRARYYAGEPSYTQLARAVAERSGYYDQGRPEVVALIPASARYVVDVGCGAGGLGKALRAARPGTQVRGIELMADQAQRAREVLDDVFVGSADQAALPASWPQPDCVIFADVLEHLYDPAAVLRRYREWLGAAGTVVVSLPNVLHHEVLAGLLRDRWDYAESGILDRTHLRFFTRSTAAELLEKSGYRIERMKRVLKFPSNGAQRRLLAWLTASQRRAEEERGLLRDARRATFADLCTFQYLIVARVA